MNGANLFRWSEDADKLLGPYRKHYSTDGGVEIVKDLVAGTTEFVFSERRCPQRARYLERNAGAFDRPSPSYRL